MRISDWSSDVCSSDLAVAGDHAHVLEHHVRVPVPLRPWQRVAHRIDEPAFVMAAHVGVGERLHPAPEGQPRAAHLLFADPVVDVQRQAGAGDVAVVERAQLRSEEHTSELQSLMRISYAVFCLKKHTMHAQKKTYEYTK